MLSFTVLVSTTGQPLPADAVARCNRPPVGELAFEPVAATTWRADGGHVLVVAWADRPGGWHVGSHGCTVATGTPWPLAGSFEAPSGVPFELTERLGRGDDPGSLAWLTGATTIVRVRPDGTGLIGAPPTGGGTVHVAHGDGVIAVSDRAALAALATGGVTRRHDLPGLLRGTLLGDRTGVTGVERLRPGGHVVLRGRLGAKRVDAAWPWMPAADSSLAELVEAATDDVARLVGLAGTAPGHRVVEVGDDPSSLVVAAALAANGTAARFLLRARDERSLPAALAIGAALDVPVANPVVAPRGGEALDARLRAAVGRTAATVAVPSTPSGPLAAIRDGIDVLVTVAPGGALCPDPGPSGRRLLRGPAASALRSADEEWAAGPARDVPDAARQVVAELDRRAPLRQRAVADLAGGATVLDPLAIPSVARLAVHAASSGLDATAALVAALHPPMLALRTDGGDAPVTPTAADWRGLAPVLEAHVLGHGRDQLDELLDLEETAVVVRSGAAPDEDTRRTLEGALTLAIWAAGTDVHRPSPGVVEPRTRLAAAPQVPTLVTGVTSTSLIELAALAVPLDDLEVDAMLGVAVDRDVRDLVARVLLAAGAAPGHLPADLDERLSGPATAHLAEAARTLLARRGGTLADPRLALTIPFWRAHVGPPRVVLVAERPPDLALRSPAALPRADLLGWWVDAVTATATTRADVRIVDPGDLGDVDEAEAVGWDGLGEDDSEVLDVLRVVRTVDSLVREVELDAARPLLRTIRHARAEEEPTVTRRQQPAAAPLHVVDELWARAVEADERLDAQRATADELRDRLIVLEDELDELRGRRGVKAAWHVLTGR